MSAGWAAEPACFELYQNANASSPEGTILLNKCTGETWLLVTVNSGNGNWTGWYPIPVDMSDGSQVNPEGESKTESDAGKAE